MFVLTIDLAKARLQMLELLPSRMTFDVYCFLFVLATMAWIILKPFQISKYCKFSFRFFTLTMDTVRLSRNLKKSLIGNHNLMISRFKLSISIWLELPWMRKMIFNQLIFCKRWLCEKKFLLKSRK